MNINRFRSIIAVISLVLMSGCVGYESPYPRYGGPASYVAPRPAIVPYGGYNYGAYPVAPHPYFDHERGERGFGHYRRHDDD